MKNIFSLALVLAFAATSFAQDDKEKPYFDMENCTICKCMKSMDMNRIKWETHKIDNGMLMVMVVPEDMKAMWGTCKKNMDATFTKMESGTKMEICQFCTSFGQLMESGAKTKELDTAGGSITLVTSDDPAVVQKIHTMAMKVQDEHKKMMEMMKKNPQKQPG